MLSISDSKKFAIVARPRTEAERAAARKLSDLTEADAGTAQRVEGPPEEAASALTAAAATASTLDTKQDAAQEGGGARVEASASSEDKDAPMTDVERKAFDKGKASALKGRVEKSMLARGERNLAARQFGDEAENVENLEKQAKQAREPAMIEAEAVQLISSAMHDPNRKQALLHSHIPEKILSNMGELEAIERDSKALYLGQVEDMIVMQTRLAWGMLDLGITDQDKWTMDDFVDQLDNLDPRERDAVENKAKVTVDEFERQVELVDENKLWLEGVMQGVDDAFELALSASEKGRAEHAVKNIASIVAGSKNNIDFEDEAARNWWRKMKDTIGRMRS